MRNLIHEIRCRAGVLLTLLATGLACSRADAAVTVIGVQYQKDKFYPEDYCLWHDRQYPGPCSINLNTGQVVKVFLKNTGGSSVTISDATLAGWSLNQVLKEKVVSSVNRPRSIYYSNLSQADIDTLEDAGAPVWYKADPKTVPAGGVAQVVMRVRFPPVTQPINIGVVTTGGTVTTNITVDANAPQLASVGFSADRTKGVSPLATRRRGRAHDGPDGRK